MIVMPTIPNAHIANALNQQNKKRDIRGILINIGDTVSFHNINCITGEIEYLHGKVTGFVDENKAKVKITIVTSQGDCLIKPCNKCRVEDN